MNKRKPSKPLRTRAPRAFHIDLGEIKMVIAPEPKPIPLLLWCPGCSKRHIDEGENATREHRTHACQFCGMLWAPAVVPTVGVRFLPGCKNDAEASRG